MKLRPRPVLERIPFAGPVSVAVREFRPSAFRYPWHQHPEVELTWILKGSGLRYVGDSIELFRPGDFCLLGANLPHTWLSPENEIGPVHSLVVQFDPARWGPPLLDLPEFAKIADLLERASCGLSFSTATAQRLKSWLQGNASPLAHFTTLLSILEQLADDPDARSLTLAPWTKSRRMNADPRVRTILAFLSRNASGPLTQKDAAQQVRLSPAAFSRFFRRAVGKTFSDRTISQIAFDSGFENLSTFNRAFRLARRMSPREFRRQAFLLRT
jgi:AraC-like DNA-binding protein